MKEEKQQSLNKGAKVDWKCQVIDMMFYKVTMVIFYAFLCNMNADDKYSWANWHKNKWKGYLDGNLSLKLQKINQSTQATKSVQLTLHHKNTSLIRWV